MKYQDLLLNVANKEFYDGVIKKNKPYWTMKNGNKIMISDMTTSHIHNTLKLLRNRSPHGFKKWNPIFQAELARREKK